MKKALLTTLLVLGVTSSMAFAGEGCPQCQGGFPPPPHGCGGPCMVKPCGKCQPPKVNIDEKLKLTDAQKAKAKEFRMQTREEMEPIINAIRTKQEQKELIKRSKDLKTEAKLEQIEKLNNQINVLQKQARELRLKNERDFESILTAKQKKVLDKIKADARKNMAKNAPKFDKKSAPKK